MKKDIHPAYNSHITITCSCGASFETGGTKDGMSIETCSQCHPIYTGKQKIVDSTGRVERFKKLAAKTKVAQTTRTKAKKAPRKKTEKKATVVA